MGFEIKPKFNANYLYSIAYAKERTVVQNRSTCGASIRYIKHVCLCETFDFSVQDAQFF